MRPVRIVIIAIRAIIAPGIVWAEEFPNPVVVDKVISANPQADGQNYALTVVLKGGQQLSIQVPAAEAVKITDGLSKAAGAGPNKQQIATVVQEVSIQAEKQGRFVLIQPRSNERLLEPLAIPTGGGDQFIQLFANKLAEAKTNARH
jgi:hypothetical protein